MVISGSHEPVAQEIRNLFGSRAVGIEPCRKRMPQPVRAKAAAKTAPVIGSIHRRRNRSRRQGPPTQHRLPNKQRFDLCVRPVVKVIAQGHGNRSR